MKKTLLVSVCAFLFLAAWAFLANRQPDTAAPTNKSCARKCSQQATPKTGTGFLITDTFSGFF